MKLFSNIFIEHQFHCWEHLTFFFSWTKSKNKRLHPDKQYREADKQYREEEEIVKYLAIA